MSPVLATKGEIDVSPHIFDVKRLLHIYDVLLTEGKSLGFVKAFMDLVRVLYNARSGENDFFLR